MAQHYAGRERKPKNTIQRELSNQEEYVSKALGGSGVFVCYADMFHVHVLVRVLCHRDDLNCPARIRMPSQIWLTAAVLRKCALRPKTEISPGSRVSVTRCGRRTASIRAPFVGRALRTVQQHVDR